MNQFKNILALDSSLANHLAITLVSDNDIIAQNITITHLESELIPIIDTLLKQSNLTIHDIHAFVLGAGPGSFMGLRIGFTVLRAWAWAWDIPITLISSLKLLQYSLCTPLTPKTLYIPCIDAKMKRVFTNIVDDHHLIMKDSDLFPNMLIQKIQTLAPNYSQIHIIGSGANLLKNDLLDLAIHYHPDIIINAHIFSREFLQNIPIAQFSQKSHDNLNAIFPQYLRLSAAEMALQQDQS